jgi:hypothetical protein
MSMHKLLHKERQKQTLHTVQYIYVYQKLYFFKYNSTEHSSPKEAKSHSPSQEIPYLL